MKGAWSSPVMSFLRRGQQRRRHSSFATGAQRYELVNRHPPPLPQRQDSYRTAYVFSLFPPLDTGFADVSGFLFGAKGNACPVVFSSPVRPCRLATSLNSKDIPAPNRMPANYTVALFLTDNSRLARLLSKRTFVYMGGIRP